MQILDLESRLDQLASENRLLQEAKSRAEDSAQDAQYHNSRAVAEAVEARDNQLKAKEAELIQANSIVEGLRNEIVRLTKLNQDLTEANKNLAADTTQRYAQLQEESEHAQAQWQEAAKGLELLRHQHNTVTAGMEGIVRDEIANALKDKNAELQRLQEELDHAMAQIKALQAQLLTQKQGESFLVIRDEDYFDSACQKLCQHMQQWVVRFSKFSDTRACRLSSELHDEKIETRLDNALLDGSDVDMLLADRTKRRDVFMSLVMSMVWEYVFTRYLFGMDREQRQRLKSLEKILNETGPQRAVAQWRAITLTLLSKRESFLQQRALDTEAVVEEIFRTLSTLLPPPPQFERQLRQSLTNVMRLAVELSIEMRTQRAEYIMLPPLQPEYDTNGDLARKVYFNAELMNERSGDTTSNEDLQDRMAVVKIVLFPLVVKKGDDFGEGEEEIVVCPAQVLVAKPQGNKKVVRVLSGAMEMDPRRSTASVAMTDAMDSGSGMI
ncbi:hypothetical protein M501DRAFT_943280 [Patellaria atrata CBS 101060]|uniref:Involucrin repeat protein n=1 Tax=Patellaria atrata CBS 101060 TaxID=1346257 RepID=A0A9P4S215_9PEZI|nr:hypothetical protein M501DRAFT_943280 [Patellaria atrata CBS 101060]